MDVIFVQSEKDDEVVVYSNEKDSKSYQFKWNLTYDDFYGLLLDAIMRKNLIESFEVRKNGFRLELVNFNENGKSYELAEANVHFTKLLTRDSSLISMVNDLKREFNKVKKETLKTIEDEKNRRDEEKQFGKLVKDLSLEFF